MDIKLTRSTDINNTVVHDLHLTEGSMTMVVDVESIQQHVKCRLLEFKGEWFLNRNEGMPYFQLILQKSTPLAIVREIFRKAIASTPGVRTVTKLDVLVDSNTRTASLTFDATTDTGQILTVGFGDFVIELGS